MEEKGGDTICDDSNGENNPRGEVEDHFLFEVLA